MAWGEGSAYHTTREKDISIFLQIVAFSELHGLKSHTIANKSVVWLTKKQRHWKRDKELRLLGIYFV